MAVVAYQGPFAAVVDVDGTIFWNGSPVTVSDDKATALVAAGFSSDAADSVEPAPETL